jgi:hypothetical protein
VKTTLGLALSVSSRSNSMRVSSTRLPSISTSRASVRNVTCPTTRSVAVGAARRGRRSSASTRAASSRGENGLVT